MHLKMKISMGGPTISVDHGAELPFDENFPFSAKEVHRFRAAEIAELVGTDEEIAAWLAANPVDDVDEDAPDTDADATPPDGAAHNSPAAEPEPTKPATKSTVKKG